MIIIASAWVRIEVNEGKQAPITVVIGALQISVIRIRTSNILQYPVWRCWPSVAGPGEEAGAEPQCPRSITSKPAQPGPGPATAAASVK